MMTRQDYKNVGIGALIMMIASFIAGVAIGLIFN